MSYDKLTTFFSSQQLIDVEITSSSTGDRCLSPGGYSQQEVPASYKIIQERDIGSKKE